VPGEGIPTLCRDAKRRGALSWGYPFFGHAKKGYKKKILNILFVHFFAHSKETNQRKGAQQLGLRLSSQRTRTRGRQELIPLLAGLKQLAALIPRSQPSLGCAATGFKTLGTKQRKHKINPLGL